MVDQHLCSCEERLARALLLVARYDKIRKPSAVIPKISHKTLGGLIGSTRSRVCYFMNKFKKLGYIEYGERCRAQNSSLSGVLKDSIFSELHAHRPNRTPGHKVAPNLMLLLALNLLAAPAQKAERMPEPQLQTPAGFREMVQCRSTQAFTEGKRRE